MDRLVVPVLSLAAVRALEDLRAQVPSEVIGVVVDVGGISGLDGLREATLAAGALRCHVVDARATVAERACWPALAAGALGVPGAPLEAALALPAVAAAAVDVANHESATAVVPWADDPADRQRLRALVRGRAPSLGLVSVAAPGRPHYSQTLWARVEAVDDLAALPSPVRRGEDAVEVSVGLERGLPRTLDGVTMTAVELLERLGTRLRGCDLPPRLVRRPQGPGGWVVDAPAARVLHEVQASVTGRVYDTATAEVAASIAEVYAAVVRDGTWFAPLRRALDGFVERAVETATAEVAVRVTGDGIEVQA